MIIKLQLGSEARPAASETNQLEMNQTCQPFIFDIMGLISDFYGT